MSCWEPTGTEYCSILFHQVWIKKLACLLGAAHRSIAMAAPGSQGCRVPRVGPVGRQPGKVGL
ncbi:hypothetical protein MGG_18032 [Pyricularia oryzae 70-15]|uniref:Uncharacterized protein n=3 Tax=Pyricularia oryzae TaxID=318829 RepID=G4NK34_PYRO7|nr:uncharacterized protein MGG_18032 [Pyricularia oryzae 70-15]EHA46519.1 hypothetical protein MGG_18032 [Pyricularia oryzae 70-15]ELQ34261.1 hypothetical protein OOU_Y34scaffold00777g19 [Pyricularia oryzae Y34]